MNSRRGQCGLSLIELMVSITVGLLVLGVGLAVLSTTLTSNTSNLRYARMNQDLRSVLTAVTRDIERAGTWGIAGDVVNAAKTTKLRFSADSGSAITVDVLDEDDNDAAVLVAPLDNTRLAGRTLVVQIAPDGADAVRCQLAITAVTDSNTLTANYSSCEGGLTALPQLETGISSWTLLNPFNIFEATSTCVRYAYDLDLDGVLDTNEFFAFRHDATNQAIETRSSSGACSASGGWEDVTDPDVLAMSAFTITPVTLSSAPGAPGNSSEFTIGIREYLVTMTGALTSEAGVTRTVQAAVKVRNNTVD